MQILAKQTIIYNGTRHKPGAVFEIDEIEGKALIHQRFAVISDTEESVEVAHISDGPVQTIGSDADAAATTVQTRKGK